MTETLDEFLAMQPRLRFLPMGGNGGDRLIEFATRKMMEWHGATTADAGEDFDFLVYGGGGLFGFYQDAHILAEVEPGPEPIVFFPRACLWIDQASLRRHVKEFHRIGRPLWVFARDPISAREWRLLVEPCGASIVLSHDVVALYDAIADDDRVKLEAIIGPPQEDLLGVYLRRDVESAKWPALRAVHWQTLTNNLGSIGCVPPADPTNGLIDHAFACYLTLALLPEVAVTDRLHVMLARWLFGRKTVLLPTAQHKAESVYSHSIERDPRQVVFAPDVAGCVSALAAFEVEVEAGELPQ